ncbi:MAG: cysteate synthase [Prolixibacteraceae bacterium]|jgi:cysteate synthase|nr:cysteate synthase [Prolixibacteraceae bacterium]MBT6004628.1 cysteate synthase [Prolixibacteraceae bacterium]MBT7000778.1 cysteate synthase [Prolixibacteraceae bacterium]MBT7395519.1 cysteate synthase [Prolixibacteraceae bacterium]
MSKQFIPTNYKLQSVKTGKIFEDKGWMLEAPDETEPTLIRAIYEKTQIEVKDNSWGLYKFADWLPISRTLKGSSAPVTYKSEGLAKELGLKNLWITFSGYWPEKNATFNTCSFKETEAYSVCGRMTPEMDNVLVVASAGNTSRSFAKVCSDNNIPLLICVPEDNLDALWFDAPLNDCVKLVSSRTGSDYFDAIHLSNIIAGFEGFVPEGGAKNVARRDGMSTTMLSATTTIGEIPDYYFQGIGSGTGAIAAWEGNLRLLADGRFGDTKMKLLIAQNIPFTPVHDAWKADSRAMLPLDEELARNQVEEMDAKVLSNRKPPYPVFGGLYDALKDTSGEVLLATNEEARKAGKLFEKTEGIDIHPAAAVATATLIEAAKNGKIEKDAIIMLNITGGGEQKFKAENELFYLKPEIIFDINPDVEDVKSKISELFK